LPVLESLDFGNEAIGPFAQSLRIAAANCRIPLGEDDSAVSIFYGHEERVVVEPSCGLLREALEGCSIGVRSVGEERLRGATQDGHLEWNDGTVIDGAFGERRKAGEIGGLEKALLGETIEAEQHWIASESREALIGRIAVTCGVERKHLPELDAGIGEEVGEFEGTWTEIADAEARGKGSDVKQDSTAAREFHLVTIRIRCEVRNTANVSVQGEVIRTMSEILREENQEKKTGDGGGGGS
jgi:hypothetical protein